MIRAFGAPKKKSILIPVYPVAKTPTTPLYYALF